MRTTLAGMALTLALGLRLAAVAVSDEAGGPSNATSPRVGRPVLPNPLRAESLPSPPRGRETASERSAPTARPVDGPGAKLEPGTAALRERLLGSDPLQAIEAVCELQRMGEAGANVLVECLSPSRRLNSGVFHAAMRAVEAIGPPAAPALGRAVAADQDAAPLGMVLESLGPQAAGAAPPLVEALRSPQTGAERRRQLAGVLAKIGKPAAAAIPALLEVFEREQDEELRVAVLHALAEIGAAPPERLPRLIACLTDDQASPRLRLAAARVLARQSTPSPVLLPTMIGLLHPSQGRMVCAQSAEIIGGLEHSAADAVPALIGLLDHEAGEVRAAAAAALGRVARPTPNVLQALVKRVQTDGELPVRQAAVESLRGAGPEGLAAIRPGLQSSDRQVRENTLTALAMLGPAASPATAALTSILADADQSEWHLQVVNVLRAIRPEGGAAQPLAALLANRGLPLEMRTSAATALGEVGPAAAPVMPLLSEILFQKEEEPPLRAAVAVAVSRIEVGAREVLLRALRDPHGLIRIAAAWCLAQREPNLPEVASTLIHELGDAEFTGYAEDALVLIGEPMLSPVAQVLRDERAPPPQRMAAARVLGRLGPQAIPHLVDCLADTNEAVALETRKSLYDMNAADKITRLLDALHERGASAPVEPANPRQQVLVDRLRRIVLDVSGELGGPGGAAPSDAPAMAAPADDPPADVAATVPSRAAPATPPAPASAMPEAALPEGNVEAAPGRDGPPAGSDAGVPAAAAAPAAAGDPAPGQTAPGEGARSAAALDAPGFKIVKVFYGTNRRPLDLPVHSSPLWQGFLPVLTVGSVTMLLCSFGFALSRSPIKAMLAALGLAATLSLAYTLTSEGTHVALPPSGRPGPLYGGEADSRLNLGTCDVAIPAIHRSGELESPSVFRLEFQADPRRHITVRSVQSVEREAFLAELKGDLSRRGPGILVFVHGYNVGFDDAARRTAQMAEDLEFAGVPLFFSWPSQGNWYEYREDEKQVELAVPRLREFLQDVVRQSDARAIHLVAHSMGSRALTVALREMAAEAEPATRFHQVILAAPDIDADVFRERIAPAISTAAQHVTLYASSNDLALVASRTFNSGDPRAGDSSRNLVVVPGIETIDVSDVDTSLLGHSYYGDNPTVLTDLKELLLHALPASQRPGLVPQGTDERRYWAMHRAATPRIAETPAAAAGQR